MKEIMKHYNQMYNEELENFNKTIEEKRMSKIDDLVQELLFLLQNQDKHKEKEIYSYDEIVRLNNRNFCVCGKIVNRGMGKPKFRCGKDYCKFYEW
jgi:hypothetical protein